jgi:hypothetical protein
MSNRLNEFPIIEAIRQLFTPLSYLRIKHPQKYLFDIFIPLAITIIVQVFLMVLPKPIMIVGENGLISIITGLIQILVGFYIASLAAVATFQGIGLDEPLAGDHATLMVKRRGVSKPIQLTRRKFVCYLFGYLAFVGIFLYFIGSASGLLNESIKAFIPSCYFVVVKWLFIFCYLFASSNLIVTTLLGLYYLTDRIHRV